MQVLQLNQWTNEATQGLQATLNDDVNELRDQVNSGLSKLWYLPDQDSWMVTRTEQRINQAPVLVVCCYQGKNLKTVSQDIVETADAQGFSGIRYHTKRPGLNRLLKELDFSLMETVFYKSLGETHGRR